MSKEWLHSETILEFAVLPHSDAFSRVERVRSAWLTGRSVKDLPAQVKRWSVPEWKYFIEGLPRSLSLSQMSVLDEHFQICASVTRPG